MNHTEETTLNNIWEEQKIDDHFFNRVWWTKNIDVEAKNLWLGFSISRKNPVPVMTGNLAPFSRDPGISREKYTVHFSTIIPYFPGFPEIHAGSREGIHKQFPGYPGNSRPGMKTLVMIFVTYLPKWDCFALSSKYYQITFPTVTFNGRELR